MNSIHLAWRIQQTLWALNLQIIDLIIELDFGGQLSLMGLIHRGMRQIQLIASITQLIWYSMTLIS